MEDHNARSYPELIALNDVGRGRDAPDATPEGAAVAGETRPSRPSRPKSLP
jgi:hypothetical protein